MSDQGLRISRSDREAAEWMTRLGPDVSVAILREFWSWRRAPDNAAAYARAEATMRVADRLAIDPDIRAATEAARERHPAPKPKLTWSPIPAGKFGAGLAAIVAIIAGGLWLQANRNPTYSTQVGQQRLVLLSDGSRVRLNSDSRIQVRFAKDRREVALARGEAFFEAAHDAARPFIVEAGDTNVRALGTRFDVRRDNGVVLVALVEGHVRVDQDDRPGAAMLSPNQQVTVSARGISTPSSTDALQSTSWTTGRLTFHDQSLGEAITQVNRYARRKVVLDAPLSEARVTGVFDVGDTQAFVDAVRAEFDLESTTEDGEIHLVRPAPRHGG